MREHYAFWAAGLAAVVLAATVVGCGDSATGDGAALPVAGNGIAAGGTGVLPTGMAGTGAPVAGTAAPMQPGMGMAGMSAIAGTGAMMPGMAGSPAAGAGGAMAAGAGAAGMGDAGGSGMAGGPPTMSTCMPTDNVDADGPHTPMHIQNGGPSGSSWVFYPEDLGAGGMKHPVFNWGPGAGTGPSQYTDHLNRLASHGFVVISQPSSGSGTTEKAALDWLLAENEMMGSTFYQKLDPERVGAGGHSLGALTTMAMAGDERLKMYVLVCGGCMSGNGGCGAADIHGPTIILGGDTDIGTPNFEGDYEEIMSPAVFVIKDGTDHIACARNNLAPWVAFMRWQFCGETQYKTEFLDGGTFCTTPWECRSKNLP